LPSARHQFVVHRVEHLQPEDALRHARARGEIADAERRRRRREIGVRRGVGERGEQLDLGVELFLDRLDDQVAIREIGGIGGHLDAIPVAAVDLAREALDGLLRSPRRSVASRQEADLAERAPRGREAARDRPRPGDRRPRVAVAAHRSTGPIWHVPIML
jgi:hypothetical protein